MFKRIRCKPRRSPVSVCRNVCSSKLSLSVTSSLDVDAVLMLFLEIPLRMKFIVSCCPFVKLYTMSQKMPVLCLAVTFTYMNQCRQFLAEMLRRKSAIKRRNIFPPHLICVSALPGETRKPEISSFHLNAACNFANKHKNTLKHHLSQLNQVRYNRGPPCVKNGSCASSRLE